MFEGEEGPQLRRPLPKEDLIRQSYDIKLVIIYLYLQYAISAEVERSWHEVNVYATGIRNGTELHYTKRSTDYSVARNSEMLSRRQPLLSSFSAFEEWWTWYDKKFIALPLNLQRYNS